MEKNKRGLFSKKWIIVALVYFGLIALCCVALYVVPSVAGMFERTYIAEHGSIDVSDEVSAFIVRDETVYAAAENSKINRLAETGKLIKAGTKAVELTPTDEPIEEELDEESEKTDDSKKDKKSGSKDKAKDADDKKSEEADKDRKAGGDEEEAPTHFGRYSNIMEELGDSVVKTETGVTKKAGYISYYVDGAEAKLSTKSLDKLSYDDFKSLTGRKAVKVPSRSCGEGYPVFKVVSNRKWYLVYYLSNDDAAKYSTGDVVTIDINGEPVTVTVSEILESTKQSRITLTCKTFFDGFLEERSLDTKVIVSSAEGLVLEDASIVEAPDGKRGVFVKDKLGKHVFTPIRTKADDGVKCVVYSDIYVDSEGNYVETIGTYDEIVAEPTEEDLETLAKQAKDKGKGRNENKSESKGN